MVAKTAQANQTDETTDADDMDVFLPDDVAHAMFDGHAQYLLNISGEEFIRRWEAGEYRDLPDTPETRQIMRVAYLIPFGRQKS